VTPRTADAVFEALRENNERPYGRPRTVRAEELVEAAEQFDDKGALVTALFELMSAYSYAGEKRKSPVVFARIVRLWDSGPGDFSDGEEHQLYSRFAGVASALVQVPEVPLAAIERWTGEMRDRYGIAGRDMQPVYAVRHLLAAHTGTGADAAYDLWVTRPRTELSDCQACETRQRALHHVAAGDDERALREWAPVLDGGSACLEEPYVSMAHALLPLLRAGRTDEARSYHLTGYRCARGKPYLANAVGLHLEFCALSGNEGRGLEVLAENRGIFETAGSPLDRLDFLVAVEVLLARLAARGHGDLPVPGPHGGDWTAGALLATVGDEASRLAAAFDARNGTAAVGGRRLARLAQGPLLDEPLALGLRASSPVPATAAPRWPVAAADPLPEDFAELVRRARELTAVGRPDADALWDRIRTAVAGAGHAHDGSLGPERVLRAELAERRAFDGFDREEWAAARTVMLEAAARYEEAGLPGRAASARARAATALVAASERDPSVDCSAARAELDAELQLAAGLLTTPDGIEPDRYLAILQCEAVVTRHALISALPEPSEEVRNAFDASIATLLSEADRLGTPPRASAARQYLADVAARTGRFDTAAEELTAALALIEAAGQPWRSPRPLALLAQIKVQCGYAEEAVPLIHQALAAAARWPDASLSLGPLLALLGHACAHRGDAVAAVRHLAEAADRLDRDGADEHAARVRLELADLLVREGRQADAVAVLESASLGDAADALDPRLHARIQLNLARGLRTLGEERAAAEEFLRLADAVAQWPDEQYTHTLVACEAAVALAAADRWDAAHQAYGRALASHATAPRPASAAGMMREFARLTMAAQQAGGLSAALSHLAAADTLCDRVPAGTPDFVHWYQTGTTHYQRARCYVSAQSYANALTELERAVTHYDTGGHGGEEPRAEATRIAALIEANALGALPAATARLDAAIDRCAAAGLPEAAAALAAVRAGLPAR
jgi:tetratricopeptide (TPR) repeat protein